LHRTPTRDNATAADKPAIPPPMIRTVDTHGFDVAPCCFVFVALGIVSDI
jgi:hypothetical protein